MPKIAGRDRRTELLEAARDLIFTEGATRFTIRRLADRVQVSEAAVYRHFNNKEALLLALLDQLFQGWSDGLDLILESPRSAADRLLQLADFHLDYLLIRQFNPILLLSDATDPDQKSLLRKLQGIAAHLYTSITRVIGSGKTSGEFDPGLEVEVAGFAVLGAIQSTALQWSLTHEKKQLRPRLLKVLAYLTRCFQSRASQPAVRPTRSPAKRRKVT